MNKLWYNYNLPRRYSMNGVTEATDLIRSLNIQGIGMNGDRMNGPQFGNGQNNTGRGLPQYQVTTTITYCYFIIFNLHTHYVEYDYKGNFYTVFSH